ncbi:glycosyltransferase [Parabacteroides sp. FAFU027]|uniref:glycosyltransferase n=1 Tax=Parabacteroides sp. FAFU027 TaxID=2922715 RepID=UPI001FAF18BE|nr:glycosyltransferase [Parabacteroides sp. FAFU027]
MKVAIITGAVPPAKCGVGDYTDVLISNLINAGIKIDVITDIKYGENNKGYVLHNVIKHWYGISFFITVLRVLKEINCDIVHIQYPTISYKGFIEINLLPILLRIKGYKVVYTLHEYSQRPLMSRIRRWPSVKASHKVIVVEDTFKIDLERLRLITSREKTEVIYIGSNIPKSNAAEGDLLRLRSQLFGNYNGLIASYFGFVNSNKELVTTIETMHTLNKEHRLFFKLLIIGELTPSDAYQNEILKRIHEYKLENEIKTVKYLPKEEVGKHIACSDFAIALFSNGVSIRNGSFLALYQEGIKVITTKPKNHYPIKLNNAIFLNSNSVSELKSALQQLQTLNLNKNLGDIINWDNIAQEHIRIYNSVYRL